MKKGFLILETGEVYQGYWHGGKDRAGEVVFNTSHSGYEEIASDPSYFSQIVVLTAPMQGNYGVDSAVWESDNLWIEGFISLRMQKTERDHSWEKRLTDRGIPILTGVDTRSLVLRLRNQGTPWGALVYEENEQKAKMKSQELIAQKKKLDKDWVHLVSRKQVEVLKGENPKGPKIAVLDFGCKQNILRNLQKYSSELQIFPSRTDSKTLLQGKPQALMLTNGPGDPADVQVATETVRNLVGKIPIFGICMGHQILALALGAKTYKMKFGHRGSNHPIKDDLLKRIYMTSQNHGYAVDKATLPDDAQVTQVNLNDQTVAGIYSKDRKFLGIQYHPESCPGPHDAEGLFPFFIEKLL